MIILYKPHFLVIYIKHERVEAWIWSSNMYIITVVMFELAHPYIMLGLLENMGWMSGYVKEMQKCNQGV